MTCMGVVKNFEGLVACRVILGIFEVRKSIQRLPIY